MTLTPFPGFESVLFVDDIPPAFPFACLGPVGHNSGEMSVDPFRIPNKLKDGGGSLDRLAAFYRPIWTVAFTGTCQKNPSVFSFQFQSVRKTGNIHPRVFGSKTSRQPHDSEKEMEEDGSGGGEP